MVEGKVQDWLGRYVTPTSAELYQLIPRQFLGASTFRQVDYALGPWGVYREPMTRGLPSRSEPESPLATGRYWAGQ